MNMFQNHEKKIRKHNSSAEKYHKQQNNSQYSNIKKLSKFNLTFLMFLKMPQNGVRYMKNRRIQIRLKENNSDVSLMFI